MSMHAVSVLILYNEPRKQGAGFAESDAGVLAEVGAVGAALKRLKLPYRSIGVRDLTSIPMVLGGADEPVVFNLVEGFQHHPEDLNYVPALVRSFGKACTGNDTPGMVLSLDKWQTKALLTAAGMPCPKAVLIEPGKGVPGASLFPGPYIVKPVSADASEGIDNASLVGTSRRRLQEAVHRVHQQLGQPAIIEQFIEGRELNISVIWPRGKPRVLPLAEIEFRDFGEDRPRIVGYEAKWLQGSFEYSHTVRVIPARLPAKVAGQVRRLAVSACRILGCTDYCRVDFRLDGRLNPYILEVNANPDIAPDAGFAAALQAAGIRYEQFVRETIQTALARMPKRPRVSVRSEARPTGDQVIRWCTQQDRDAVVALLAGTQFFRPDEMVIAKEVLDAGIKDGPSGHYQSYVIATSGRVGGWVCFGPTPCTLGTFDVYWIAVDPASQGQGLGKKLMAFAEAKIAACGGRLAVAETSGRQVYQSTRAFYERLGYRAATRIADFYGPGDDKVVFSKDVTDQAPVR
jgi:D-alanine-D-alanine ligase